MGNSIKTASKRYNFTDTLAIEMYLGKHDAYSILNTCTELQQFFLAAIEKQLLVGIRNVRAKKLSCQHKSGSIDLRLLILPKTCSKVRNSVFATHCTVNTLNVVHKGSHTVAISELLGVTPSTTF